MCYEEIWLYTCNHVKTSPVLNCGLNCPPGTGMPFQGPEADVPCEDCQLRAALAEIRDLGGDTWTLPSLTGPSPCSTPPPPLPRRRRAHEEEGRSVSPDLPHEPYVTTDPFARSTLGARMRGALPSQSQNPEPPTPPRRRRRRRRAHSVGAERYHRREDVREESPSPPPLPRRRQPAASYRTSPPSPATPPATPPRHYSPDPRPSYSGCICRDQIWHYNCNHDRTYRVQPCERSCSVAIRLAERDVATACPDCIQHYSSHHPRATRNPRLLPPEDDEYFPDPSYHDFTAPIPAVTPIMQPASYLSMLRDTMALRLPSYLAPRISPFPLAGPLEYETSSPSLPTAAAAAEMAGYAAVHRPLQRSYTTVRYEYDTHDRHRRRHRSRHR